MGTWGTGPLNSDNALNMVGVIGFDPSRYREVILARLLPLTDMVIHHPRHPDELAEDMQGALAACAVVADVKHGEYFYTRSPDDPDDFCLETVDQQEDLESLARQALGMYRKLETETVDLGWRSSELYTEHRRELSRLAKRLA